MQRSESLEAMLRSASDAEPPSEREEKELVARVAAGDKAAEDELVRRNLRLVFDIARRYQTPGANLEDLLQEGSIGLVRAARRFDPDRGFRFSTFAHWWVRQGIARFVKGPTRSIRLPEYVQDRIGRVYRSKEDLAGTLGREPSRDEVSHDTGLPAREVDELFRLSRDAGSLDASLADNPDLSVRSTLSDNAVVGPEDAVQRRSELRHLLHGLGRLQDRQTRVLAYRFGLADGMARSRPWIGAKLGLSAERVRQIEKSALRRLREDLEAKDYAA